MNDTRRYHEVTPIGRDEALAELESGDPKRIAYALVRVAFHESELRWAQQQCERFCSHDDADVRGVAVTCLGHLARLHGDLDLTTAGPILRTLAEDPQIGGRAEDAWDDIRQFVKSAQQ